jgi:hypothetical protein
MSVVTFLYDIESDIFWVVGVTNPRTFRSGSDATVNASKLIVAPALDELYYVDATTTPEIRGISLPLNGVTKAELNNLIGYEFKIAFTNCSHINTVLISNVTATATDTIWFKESTRIYTPCILTCMVGESGDINYNVNNGEMFDDVTSLAIASYPTATIQPSPSNPLKVYRTGFNKYLVCGTLITTAAFTISDYVTIFQFTPDYKSKFNANFNSVAVVTTTFVWSSCYLILTTNGMSVGYGFTKAQATGSELRIYFEYIRA